MLRKSIGGFFLRLQKPPDDLDPKNYGFYVACNFAALVAFLLSVMFLPVYLSLNLSVLAAFNILCVCVWPVVLLLNLRGHLYAPLTIANFEIVAHASWDVVFSGQGTGFIYFIMVLPFFIFLAPWKLFEKIALSGINALACGAIYYWANMRAQGLSGPEHPLFDLLHLSNLVFMFIIICLGAFYYRRAMLKVENELETTVDLLNGELAEAAEYVRSSLPNPLDSDRITSQWEFIPSASLGGDAFGYHWIDADHFAVYLIDVSGHGVGAALLSVSVMNALRSQTLPDVDFCRPDQVLAGLNRAFPAEKHNAMFFTVWYGVYHQQRRQMSFSTAGHPAALLFNGREGRAIELKTGNAVIGALENIAYENKVQPIENEASLYVFSDGVYEFVQADGSRWRFPDFVDFIVMMHQGDAGDLFRLVDIAKNRKQADIFEDDFTIVKLTFK